MAKNNSKSIRLSDKVLEYIEDYKGNGFNEKFENIILYAMESEDKRKKDIEYLDKDIANRKEELLCLSQRLHSYRSRVLGIESSLRQLENLVKE